MSRLWIVQVMYTDGSWGPCDFGDPDTNYVSTNYRDAHDLKRKNQEWLKTFGSDRWYKSRFRVREYIPLDG